MKERRSRFLGFLVAICLLGSTGRVVAGDFEVRLPKVDVHELEYDQKFAVTRDRRASKRNEQSLIGELEYGFSRWWSTAIEAQWERPGGVSESLSSDSLTWENRFQLSKPDNDWADVGLFLEYERNIAGAPDQLRVGPLLGRRFGESTSANLNLLLVENLGHGATGSPAVNYAIQVRHDLSKFFAPGFEAYGGPEWVQATNARQDRHRVGPVLFGVLPLGDVADIRYEVGYLFGLSHDTPSGTFKFLLGYEKTF